MKIKLPDKKSIVLFLFSVSIFTFLSSGILIFFLNGYFSLNLFNQIAQNYTPFFTYTAVTRSYPRVWESTFYFIRFSTSITHYEET
jgi:hypothetical protein